MNTKGISAIVALFLVIYSCSSVVKTTQSRSDRSIGLKDYYKDYFDIGVGGVSPLMLHGEDSALIVTHFNSLTVGNVMMMGSIHPRENEYFWKDADSIAAFAQKHGMKLRGHTLCWHQQTPSWMFVDAKGDTVSK